MLPRSLTGALTTARRLWGSSRPGAEAASASNDTAGDQSSGDVDVVVAHLRDRVTRARLADELAVLREDRERERFHVVVFGAGGVGKTSLVHALLGRTSTDTPSVEGVAPFGETRTESVEGVEGTLLLTDTPRIAAAGAEGAWDEAEALELATKSDLLLFVVEQDLHRFEQTALSLLIRNGKRTLVVLNKKDRFLATELAELRAKLRERLAGLVAPEDIVAAAAAPRPLPLRVRHADGREETVIEYEAPDLSELEGRVETVLAQEGKALRAANLLLRAYFLRKQANDELAHQRRKDAQEIIDRYQWLAAKAVFAVPIPEMDLLAAGAVEYRMISEVAAVYGVALTTAHVQMIGDQMVRILLRRRLVETATAWISGLFKSTLVGYAAGGMVQAATVAYLTHVTGHAFLGYFERGQDWGDGGMPAALARQFEGKRRTAFFKEFAQQAIDRLNRRMGRSPGSGERAAR